MFQDLSALVYRQAAMIEEQSVRIQQLKDEKDHEVQVSRN